MLEINNFSLVFDRYERFSLGKNPLSVISNLDLSVTEGKITAVIGSSGAGKSLLAHAILGILPENARCSGTMNYKNEVLTEKRKNELRGRDIVLIPQSVNFLNPMNTAGKHIFRAAYLAIKDKVKAMEIMKSVIAEYGLSEDVQYMYPHEISGGMARRILAAIAVVSGASLIIADEPTTGLDGTARDESLFILRELADSGKGIVLITHDIDAALNFADNIAVFYAGTTIEFAPVSSFKNPELLKHPFSRALIDALPRNSFSFIPGNQPDGTIEISGCKFELRCPRKTSVCAGNEPDRINYNNGFVRCYNAGM